MANAQAIVAAWIAYSLAPRSRYFAAERAWLAQKTNATGAWATKNWSRAARASAARSLSRVTRKISYPCRFPADGAAFAAASTCAIFSASTPSGANARTDSAPLDYLEQVHDANYTRSEERRVGK